MTYEQIKKQRDKLAEALCRIAGWSDEHNPEHLLEKIKNEANKTLSNLDSELQDEIRQDIRNFIDKQQPLGSDFQRVLSENMDELLMRDDDSEPAEQPAVPEGWILCSERLPTENDQDAEKKVWAFIPEHFCEIKRMPWIEVKNGNWGITHWKSTGLKRPEPPQGEHE